MALGDGEVAQRNPWAPAVPAPRRPRRGPGMTGLLILGFEPPWRVLLAIACFGAFLGDREVDHLARFCLLAAPPRTPALSPTAMAAPNFSATAVQPNEQQYRQNRLNPLSLRMEGRLRRPTHINCRYLSIKCVVHATCEPPKGRGRKRLLTTCTVHGCLSSTNNRPETSMCLRAA